LTRQVGFKDEKQRRYITVASKCSSILNRLEKTKQERQTDLKAERQVRVFTGRGCVCLGGGGRVGGVCA
jgi:hypothetical protein